MDDERSRRRLRRLVVVVVVVVGARRGRNKTITATVTASSVFPNFKENQHCIHVVDTFILQCFCFLFFLGGEEIGTTLSSVLLCVPPSSSVFLRPPPSSSVLLFLYDDVYDDVPVLRDFSAARLFFEAVSTSLCRAKISIVVGGGVVVVVVVVVVVAVVVVVVVVEALGMSYFTLC